MTAKVWKRFFDGYFFYPFYFSPSPAIALTSSSAQGFENPLSKLLLEMHFLPKSIIPVDVDPVREPGGKFGRAVH